MTNEHGNQVTDITGRQIGELTVVKYSHTDPRRGAFWECHCSCGMTKIVDASALLRKEPMQSCGCLSGKAGKKTTILRPGLRVEDLTGRVFNEWTVIRYSHYSNDGWAWWECRCSCGTIRSVRAHSLTHGTSRSCNCKKITRHHSDSRVILNENGNPIHDLSGKKFRMLTVVGYSHSIKDRAYWTCLCDCGNQITVRATDLKKTKTCCGCVSGVNTMDVGVRYGRLVVKKIIPGGKRLYVCDCGNELIAINGDVRSGKTQSCGCLRRESTSITGSAAGKSNTYQSGRYNWTIAVNGKEIRLRSGYEMIYAQYLIRNHMQFEYEPQVFVLSPSLRYTPDFYLPDTNLWVELKGEVTPYCLNKIKLFEQVTGNRIEMITGNEIAQYLPEISYSRWLKENAYKYLR
jgi:hypothetical protein